ncbi:E3 SUMO-protein ligase PIAS2 [Neolamprologus brichardi]|uniref:E3 SUMO-protein ligase PIAS2 n=1 Tax=Neolamprologus brichardi TaxID=32507 RepID=UPI001643B6C5|nr:E3 SUMO-protein ligase PIAS2 [Neolamprologus brichardi]
MNLQQPAPLIPPVHPDVQMKPLPFYDVLDVLIKPSSLDGCSASVPHSDAATKETLKAAHDARWDSCFPAYEEKYFIFALTPQQVREVCISRDFLPGGRRDYMVQIQLRFCLSETSCPQEDNYPNSLCIKVNGKLFPLPGYAPPPKNGVEQKRPGRPLNITSLVRLSSAVPNQISVTWAPEIGKCRNVLKPCHVCVSTCVFAFCPPLCVPVKEKLTADPDSEIATTSLRVSLMCPLGKMRLTVPCRAVTCSHLQCFDAALYLQMNEKKPTWICPVCDKKAAYESLIIDGLFLEILNDCSDVDEIKFQEDGTWCPMRPKKEAVKIPTQSVPKVDTSAPLRQPSVAPHSTEPSYTKRADVIDLTIESSSSDDEEDKDPPPKKRCVYISKNEEMHAKGVLSYQPTVRVPNVQALDPSYLNSTLADYAVPFHPSALASIPTDMQSLDLFSLIQTDPQHYPPQMFLDNLTSSMQNAAAATSSAALVSSSSSHYDAISHAASSFHDTRVLTGGGGGTGGGADGGISDIISLD